MGLATIRSTRAKITVTSLALCLLGTGSAMTLSALPAAASTGPTMAQGETPEQSPGGSTLGEWPIPKGTAVTMKCWTEGPNVDGGKKWFEVVSKAYPFPEGYVPANSVANQSSAGLC
jgi:hypothetical protein